MRKQRASKNSFIARHSLSLAAIGFLALWVVLYVLTDPDTHWGAFFGNAIADWTGMVVMVFATKHLYEKGSSESKEPPKEFLPRTLEHIREHSLTIFLLATGAVWVATFAKMNPQGRWGEVVGNIVSEWTQILGLVLLTKNLIEKQSKESK